MRALCFLGWAAVFAGCSQSDAGPAGPSHTAAAAESQPAGSEAPGSSGSPASVAAAADIASSTSDLQWKRYAAIEADLSAALELPREALCREFGQAECIREVHLGPLGGNEPFKSGLLKPSREPLATTPTVIDRVVLAACSKRAELDASDAPGMFGKKLDLGVPDAPAPESEEARATIVDLYRRLLARDPSDDEITLVASLARDEKGAPVPVLDFAKAACFAIGTTTEFLFF